MTIISVRITDKEKAQLAKYGKTSEIVREAINYTLVTGSLGRFLPG
jgi:hypothetical protein